MVIAVYNHKGGTGKTTTTINVGSALANLGNSVLLVDLDPQANMTYSLGIDMDDIDEVVLDESSIIHTNEGVDLLPNITTPQFLIEYSFPYKTYLYEEMASVFDQYDYVLIDCPPAVDMTVVNAIMAADGVIIPVILDALSVEALRQVTVAIESLLEEHQKELDFISVLPVMVDTRRQLSKEVINHIKSNFEVVMFDSHIRMNVKIAEAPSYGKSVLKYSGSSNGAKDYIDTTDELLKIKNRKPLKTNNYGTRKKY